MPTVLHLPRGIFALCCAALLALLCTTHLAGASWLEGVNWDRSYARVDPVALDGRVLLVLIADAGDPPAKAAIDAFTGQLANVANQYDLATLLVQVGGTIPMRADGKEPRIAYGIDRGGLLRAFAGSESAIMLVFSPDGTLLHVMHATEIVPNWFNNVMKLDVNSSPLLDANNVASTTPKTKAACGYFLRGDLSQCFKTVAHSQDEGAVTQALGLGIQNAVSWNLKVLADDKATHAQVFRAAERLRSLLQIGVPDRKQVLKALEPLKKNPDQLKEQEAWKAFLNYVPSVAGVAKADAPALQQKLLRPILAKYPDTSAAMMASAILAFSGASAQQVPSAGPTGH